MKRCLGICAMLVATTLTTNAQVNEFEKEFEEFTRQARKNYNDFRSRANKEYADFIRKAWEVYQAKPEIPKPKDEPPVPPTPYPKDDKDEPIEDTPKPYDEVVPVVEPEPQPKPVEPIREEPQPKEESFTFGFFQTACKVRLGENQRFSLKNFSKNALANAWDRLAGSEYNNVIRDCLELRIQHRLCDWAYLLMLQELSDAYLGKGTNESTLLCAYLYCQSGYQMRLGLGNNKLYLMMASKHQIYGRPYWEIEGMSYYPLNCNERSLEICGASFPKEQPLSLLVADIPLFAEQLSNTRTLQSEHYQDMKVQLASDNNLINFFDTYPSSMIGGDFCTRWAFYANTPMSKRMKEQLYPFLRNTIQGKTQLEAVNKLLNFVQTAFVYEYDDKVWGGDRAFFAEESLYYPYCDCEDRSILFSRLVRDLLGLEVMLVYYPGHLATAVHFTEHVIGDYILYENLRYIVCDPTYIGAPVGTTMPDMDNNIAKVIKLR